MRTRNLDANPLPASLKRQLSSAARLFVSAIAQLGRLTILKPLSWSELRRIRRLSLGKIYSAFVILIPLSLSFAAWLSKATGHDVMLPANMILAYFGSLSFLCGTIAFDLLCPRVVRENESRFHFIAKCLDHAVKKGSYKKGLEANREAVAAAYRTGQNMEERPVDLGDVIDSEMRVAEVDQLEGVWRRKIATKPLGRLCASVLFAASFLITAYVTVIDTPQRVLGILAS